MQNEPSTAMQCETATLAHLLSIADAAYENITAKAGAWQQAAGIIILIDLMLWHIQCCVVLLYSQQTCIWDAYVDVKGGAMYNKKVRCWACISETSCCTHISLW